MAGANPSPASLPHFPPQFPQFSLLNLSRGPAPSQAYKEEVPDNVGRGLPHPGPEWCPHKQMGVQVPPRADKAAGGGGKLQLLSHPIRPSVYTQTLSAWGHVTKTSASLAPSHLEY